jgi:adenosylhomocysteine nucleosidase
MSKRAAPKAAAKRVSLVDDIGFTDPCIIFTLGRESQAFRREFPPTQRFFRAPCWARFCGPSWLSILVLETGIGAARTERALGWLLNNPRLGVVPYRPQLVISAGFAGALHPDRRIGDIVFANEIVNSHGNSWPTTWPVQLPQGEWQPPLHRGRLLTTDGIVATTAEKLSLGEKHGAVAVDMESAIVARACSERGIPFASVRAVSDELNTPLSPSLVGVLRNGRVDVLSLIGSLMFRPALIREMWRLARHTTFAGSQLGKALGELLTLTTPYGDEYPDS